MARKNPAVVTVRARISFNEVRVGDVAELEMDAKLQGWIDGGYVEVISGGEAEAGPGGAEPDAEGRVPA